MARSTGIANVNAKIRSDADIGIGRIKCDGTRGAQIAAVTVDDTSGAQRQLSIVVTEAKVAVAIYLIGRNVYFATSRCTAIDINVKWHGGRE